MTGFEVFKTYMAVKNHFKNDKYDFFKYNGKFPVRLDTFENRNDKYFFNKLSKKQSIRQDCTGYFVGNYYFDEEVKWIGDLVSEESEKKYIQWKGKQESLRYNYLQDLKKIENLDQALKVPKGEYPELFYLLTQNQVSLDTVCIINSLVNFVDYWDSRIADTTFWPEVKKRITKYQPFLNIDTQKYKQITIQQYKQ